MVLGAKQFLLRKCCSDCLKLAQKNTAAVKAWDVSIFSIPKEHSAYSSVC